MQFVDVKRLAHTQKKLPESKLYESSMKALQKLSESRLYESSLKALQKISERGLSKSRLTFVESLTEASRLSLKTLPKQDATVST